MNGRPGRAVLLAMLPFALLAMLTHIVGFELGFPLIGSAVAGVALVWLVLHHVGLLAGALAGGFVAERRVEAQAAELPRLGWGSRAALAGPEGVLPGQVRWWTRICSGRPRRSA